MTNDTTSKNETNKETPDATVRPGSNNNRLYYLIPGLCTVLLATLFYYGLQQDYGQYQNIVLSVTETEHGHENTLYDSTLDMYLVSDLSDVGGYKTTIIEINDEHVHVDIADTQQKRTLGLGNRPAQFSERGMLFIFERPASHGIWMKNMNYALDIIWLDETKNVVHTETNVSPDSYPTTIYEPSVQSQYILELPAGTWITDGTISW